MKKFEYKTISFEKAGGLFKGKDKSNSDDELNILGQQGWECVSVYLSSGSAGDINYLLKREIE
ncbi:DUF4177 domain-containing protein [Cytobacillus praedii]|uniref:DUF4177 domain-containing protein n=1 Tax=Cytobacillus praedii TaxID=1742358 RepID=A0A4R1B3F9_9BACI|nr:DUF4177 domain-containing protein [Cytobacillus praedii]TCJ04482.1 DUF4177 domain-containing protein [Cytobacillus praedii]